MADDTTALPVSPWNRGDRAFLATSRETLRSRIQSRRDRDSPGFPASMESQGVSDAIVAALSRGVDLVVPPIVEQLREDFPPDLPSQIVVQQLGPFCGST